LEVVIGGLQPEAQYQFQVAAYTRKGDGERSRPKKIRTRGAGRGLMLYPFLRDRNVVNLSEVLRGSIPSRFLFLLFLIISFLPSFLFIPLQDQL